MLMTVNLKNNKYCFCNTTERKRLMGFLGKEEGYRAELQNQPQRWERKEAGKTMKDSWQPGLRFAHGHILLHAERPTPALQPVRQEQPSPRSGPTENQAQLRTTLNQDFWLKSPRQVSPPPSAETPHVPPTDGNGDTELAAKPRSEEARSKWSLFT